LIFLKLISLASRSSSPTLSPAELNLYTRTGTFLDSVASSAAGLDGFDENLLIKISSDVHAARKLLSLSSFASSESDKSRVMVFVRGADVQRGEAQA
jgi:hypothetical protein